MNRPASTSVSQYREQYATCARLPPTGRPREELLGELRAMAELEAQRWAQGYASGAVYNHDQEHVDFLNEVYALHSQANPLHTDLWPSAVKFESEIVSMVAHMLHGEATGQPVGSDEGVCGTVSSGGTESILLAMKTYRDHARAVRGIVQPEMIVPVTGHAAFDKAAHYFGMKMVHTPMDASGRADVAAVGQAITANTAVIVGSAPSFPYGIVDPIEELSELARARGIGFHSDACLGGFVLPWAEKLGHAVPRFDFRLPGVTSISCDTHKFGYAAKGTSVVLYRTPALRRHQYFTLTDWPGGLYCTPTLAGSRPGALSAACWAALVSMGEEGYLAATRAILETTRKLREGLRERFPELWLYEDSLFMVAFRAASDELDIYRVLDAMTARGWSLNGLHRPAAMHVCVTRRTTLPGVAERLLEDLRAAVDEVKATPGAEGGLAPLYGMANTLPERGLVAEAMVQHMDGWYQL